MSRPRRPTGRRWVLLKETVARGPKSVRKLLTGFAKHATQTASLGLQPLDLLNVGTFLHRGIHPGAHRITSQGFPPLRRQHLGWRPVFASRRLCRVVKQCLNPLAQPLERASVALRVQV